MLAAAIATGVLAANDNGHADCDRGSEGEAPAEKQRRGDRHCQDHVDPCGPTGSVSVVLTQDGANNRNPNPGNDQHVEPVAPCQRPESAHGLKVLPTPEERLGRENEPDSSERMTAPAR